MKRKMLLFAIVAFLLIGAVKLIAENAPQINAIEMNDSDRDSLFITLYFSGTVSYELVGTSKNYQIFEAADTSIYITPYLINIDSTDGISANLFCIFDSKKEYKVKFSDGYRSFTYTGTVKNPIKDSITSLSGIIMFENGAIKKPDFQLGFRPVSNMDNYCFDFIINDSWFGILPYRLEGTLTTTPDSVQNYLEYSNSIDRFIGETGHYELLGKLKIDANQKCDNADITAGGGLVFYVPYSRELPIIKVIGNTKYPVRDARAYLGFEGGGAYKKGFEPDNIWRFNGEIAWRIPILSTNSFISLQSKGWLLTNNTTEIKGWTSKGYIKMDIEYAIGNMTGITINYENGSLPPDFVEKKSVSVGFMMSPGLQKTPKTSQ